MIHSNAHYDSGGGFQDSYNSLNSCNSSFVNESLLPLILQWTGHMKETQGLACFKREGSHVSLSLSFLGFI